MTEPADREEIVTDPDPDTQLVLAEMLRDGRAAWERAIRQRDEARVTIEHVRALLSKWGADRETYPPTDGVAEFPLAQLDRNFGIAAFARDLA